VDVSTEFLVLPSRTLQPSDFVEFDLVSDLKKRNGALPKFSESQSAKEAKKPWIVSIQIKRMTRWLSPKFPHGSKRRRKARTLVSIFPRYFRNQIASALAQSFIGNAQSLQNVNYSMDQGFGLPISNEPLVTIVIPLYNNWWVTYRCLRALQSNSDSTPYEVVVVDDASSDQTMDALQSVRGITVVRNLTNVGYLTSTNRGADQASKSSKYLVLLNNDTEPIDGWLDNLYRAIEKDESIGIVGSALVYPNGVLQEAGGQIFASGNAWNLGRGGNPHNALYAFTREVDYCSAASIIVRKSFWIDAGGFDTRYVPAYCEDSDLAFAAWNKGYKVLYEPKSWVIHHEGLSHGKSTHSGLKKYQIANNRKLFAKWEADLRNHWEDVGIPRFEANRDSKGIVVVCDKQLPALTRDAGSVRTFQILKHIQALGYHAVLVCLDNSTTQVDLDYLQSTGVEVHQDLQEFYDALFLRRDRVRAIWTIRQEVYDFFAERLREISPSATFIADLMDIKYREDYNPNSGISQSQLKIANEVEHLILVSEDEAREFKEVLNIDKVSVVWAEYEPQTIEIDWKHSKGLIFVGGFRHLPNLEGIEWFSDNVVPILNELGFDAPIRVIGTGLSTQKIAELEAKGLQMLGGVEDLGAIYKESRIAIIPLLEGAGRKGKVGEALSYGIPIVSTSVGTEGFSEILNSGIFVEDTPAEMAKAILDLHESVDLWSRASSLGKKYCASNLSSRAMRNEIRKLLPVELPSDD
jgi:GT2 family glycosyltransferase